MKLYRFNPEMQRYIWQDFNLQKMIVMPAVIMAIFFLVRLSTETSLEFFMGLKTVSLTIFICLVMIWGAKCVSESVSLEVRDRTWETQRLTSLGPWEMTFGKLLGSSLYAWYGGVFCIIGYYVASYDITFIISLIMVTVMSHAYILMGSVIEIRDKPNKKERKLNFSVIVIIAFIVVFFLSITNVSEHSSVYIRWFSFHVLLEKVTLFSLFFFAFWAMIGAYRSMRVELQFRNAPWMWIFFLFSLMIYCSGFVSNIEKLKGSAFVYVCLFISFGIAVAVTYLATFEEAKNIVDFRLLIDHIKQGRFSDAQYNVPVWLSSLLFCVFLGASIVFVRIVSSELDNLLDITIEGARIFLHPLSAVCVLLFLLRDIYFILFVNLNDKYKNPDAAALVYLLILYALIPSLLWAADFDRAVGLFLPVYLVSPEDVGHVTGDLVGVFIECVFIFVLLYHRWRSIDRKLVRRKAVHPTGS